MEQKKKIKTVMGTLVSVLVLAGFVFFKTLSINSEKILLYPMEFFKEFISVSAGLGPSEAVYASVTGPLFFIAPFIPITLAFTVLVYYGIKFGEDKKLGLVSCLLPSLVGFILLGFSVTAFFFALGVVVCGTLCTTISSIYANELKEWKRYRTGSRTVGKCFFMLNMFLLIGLLMNVYFSIGDYNELYRQESKEIFLQAIPQMGKGNTTLIDDIDMLNQEQREMIEEQYDELSEEQQEIFEQEVGKVFETGTMPHIINFFIFSIPFMVFSVLEILRMVLFSPMAGALSKMLLYETRV